MPSQWTGDPPPAPFRKDERAQRSYVVKGVGIADPPLQGLKADDAAFHFSHKNPLPFGEGGNVRSLLFGSKGAMDGGVDPFGTDDLPDGSDGFCVVGCGAADTNSGHHGAQESRWFGQWGISAPRVTSGRMLLPSGDIR